MREIGAVAAMSSLISPDSVGVHQNEPDPEGVRQAFSRIGYSLEEALADLIDNSIDAGAGSVLIRIFRSGDAVERVVIADDGRGIPADRVDECMQFGARIQHGPTDRGKYGIGLKSASFSQARSLAVISRSGADVVGRRWTVDSIRRGWFCELLGTGSCTALLDQDWAPVSTAAAGTLIIWDQIDHIRTGRAGIDATLNRIFRTVPAHLGMVFHRLIESGMLRIVMDSMDISNASAGPSYEVHPLNPFGYKNTGRPGYPRDLSVPFDGTPLVLRCHIWPPKVSVPEYKLGGKVAQRQGFYFYRNDRLIQAGGWNGWREEDSEPHLSLARVEVNLPPKLDAAFGLNVQKSGVDVGMEFKRMVDSAKEDGWGLREYTRDAEASYRNVQPLPKEGPLVLGRGFPRALRRFVRKNLSDGKAEPRPIAVTWATLPVSEVFRIDREGYRLILNRRYRESMDAGDNALLVKVLAFLALRDEFNRERLRVARAEWLASVNGMLLLAMSEAE
jgi:hypothetical protein